MKHIRIAHYVTLLVILGVGVVAFYFARPNVSLQLLIGIATAVAYVVWGLIHHVLEHDLHHKIVIEYMLIGAIAIVLLMTILGF